MAETMTITASSHPTLFKACEAISHDAGAQAGWSMHTVPARNLDAIETALAGLTIDEMETFCMGDIDEAEEIASRSPDLMEAHRVLNEFFTEHLPSPSLPEPAR